MKMEDIRMERRNLRHNLEAEKETIFYSLNNMVKLIDNRLEELYRLKDILEKAINENIHTNEDIKILETINYEIDSLQDDYSTLTTLEELKKIKEIG